MSSSCATVPTETQFQVVTSISNSLSTSVSIAVTTLQPAIVTSTTTLCSGSSSNSACSTSTVLVTGPVSTSTISVPVTITVPVTFTTSNPTRTLFSTACNSALSSSSSSISTSQTPESTSASSTGIPTPTSAPVSSSSTTTLSNGNVVITQIIVTSTSPPSSTVVSSVPSPSLNHSSAGANSTSKTAPIVGGTVGGIIALLAVIGGIWYIWRRSKSWKDIFDREQDEEKRRSRMSIDGDVQPRPYHYGLVGHSTSPSPPGSPPLGAVTRSGHSPANSLSLLNAPPHHQHSRSSSGGDLSSPATMSRSLSDLASASASGHVRPTLSTASSGAASTRPLLERPVNHSRTPSAWSVDAQNSMTAVGWSRPTPPSPRPHSAGGTMQNLPTSATVTEQVARPQSSPINEKRRLLASLPPGAAVPALPSASIDNGSPPIPGPSLATESSPPPIRKRNPNRPSSAKNSDSVTVHTDGGPAAEVAAIAVETDQQSRPEGNEPPAYSPT